MQSVPDELQRQLSEAQAAYRSLLARGRSSHVPLPEYSAIHNRVLEPKATSERMLRPEPNFALDKFGTPAEFSAKPWSIMKSGIQSLFPALVLIFCGDFLAAAPSSLLPVPIVVSLSEINRETECIVVRPRQVREEGYTNQVPCLTFFFQRKQAAEVDAMAEDLVLGHRLVRIEDGTNLIAECKIVGRATYQQTGGNTLHGLVLAFDWLGDAERAATAMREDWETYLRRKLDQRGSWYDLDPKLRGW